MGPQFAEGLSEDEGDTVIPFPAEDGVLVQYANKQMADDSSSEATLTGQRLNEGLDSVLDSGDDSDALPGTPPRTPSPAASDLEYSYSEPDFDPDAMEQQLVADTMTIEGFKMAFEAERRVPPIAIGAGPAIAVAHSAVTPPRPGKVLDVGVLVPPIGNPIGESFPGSPGRGIPSPPLVRAASFTGPAAARIAAKMKAALEAAGVAAKAQAEAASLSSVLDKGSAEAAAPPPGAECARPAPESKQPDLSLDPMYMQRFFPERYPERYFEAHSEEQTEAGGDHDVKHVRENAAGTVIPTATEHCAAMQQAGRVREPCVPAPNRCVDARGSKRVFRRRYLFLRLILFLGSGARIAVPRDGHCCLTTLKSFPA